MNFSELVRKEQREMKARMMEESGGTYVLLYALMAIGVIMSASYGFQLQSGDVFTYIIMVWMPIVYVSMCCKYIKSVKEKNKQVNIFEKYRYVPIDLNRLVKAKMVVFAKYTAIPIILGQLLAIIIWIVNPDNEQNRTVEFLFVPICVGVVLYIYEYIYMKIQVHSACRH